MCGGNLDCECAPPQPVPTATSCYTTYYRPTTVCYTPAPTTVCYTPAPAPTTVCYSTAPQPTTSYDSSLTNELELLKLRRANTEMKQMINKMDRLESSLVTTHTDYYVPPPPPPSRPSRRTRTTTTVYRSATSPSPSPCDDLEALNDELEQTERRLRQLNRQKRDCLVYPVYRSTSRSSRRQSRDAFYYDDYDSSSRSRSGGRSGSRRRSTSVKFYSTSSSPTSEEDEGIRPQWNGGPYSSAYIWRDNKLNGEL